MIFNEILDELFDYDYFDTFFYKYIYLISLIYYLTL